MLDARVIEDFKASLDGELIQPSDAGYDAARRIHNGMIDKRPRLIARCANTADVVRAVNFGRTNKLTIAVRGGGHNGPGLSLCDDGLVIDLALMKGIDIDIEKRTVQVQPGCRWGDVDRATHPFGLATVSGIISTTGVGGLTLGGGHGYLTRKHGLTVDNLLSVEMVLADGRTVTANERENPDLFWAIRGGGGNFGVVTSFRFRLHPVHTVYAGPMFWPMERAEEVLRWYRGFLPNAGEDLFGFFAFLVVPPAPPFPPELHGKQVCGIIWCYYGPPERSEETFRPVREFAAPPLFEYLGEMPYPALQSMFDGLYPPGLQWYWKGDFIRELSDEAVALHVKHGSRLPTPISTMHLYPVDGAVHRVRPEDTAFSFRDSHWSQVIAAVSPDPADNERMIAWARGYYEELHPYSAGGAYVNFMMEEGQERIQATYGDNYKRLVEVKTKYDPENLFHVNQNIKPRG